MSKVIERKTWDGSIIHELSFEDSQRAVDALGLLSLLGLVKWRNATEEEDSLGIDSIGEINVVAHDGYCMSPYVIVNGIYLQVSKGMVRTAWGTLKD